MAEVRLALALVNDSVSDRNFALRCACVSLYSHCEGGIRETLKIYLQFIQRQRPAYCLCTPAIAALDARRHFAKFSSKSINTEICEAVDNLRDRNRPVKLPIKRPLAFKSNITFDRLTAAFRIAGGDTSSILASRAIWNERLLKNRNESAHGGRVLIDLEQYTDMHNRVVHILHSFSEVTKTSIQDSRFLIHSSS